MIRSVSKVALRLSNKPVISAPKRQLSGNLCGLQTFSTGSICFLRTIPGAAIRFNSTFEKNGRNSSVDNSPATKSETNTANSAPYYIPKILKPQWLPSKACDVFLVQLLPLQKSCKYHRFF